MCAWDRREPRGVDGGSVGVDRVVTRTDPGPHAVRVVLPHRATGSDEEWTPGSGRDIRRPTDKPRRRDGSRAVSVDVGRDDLATAGRVGDGEDERVAAVPADPANVLRVGQHVAERVEMRDAADERDPPDEQPAVPAGADDRGHTRTVTRDAHLLHRAGDEPWVNGHLVDRAVRGD